jgi:hypothetical protein
LETSAPMTLCHGGVKRSGKSHCVAPDPHEFLLHELQVYSD